MAFSGGAFLFSSGKLARELAMGGGGLNKARSGNWTETRMEIGVCCGWERESYQWQKLPTQN